MPSSRNGASVCPRPAPIQFVPHVPACDDAPRVARLSGGAVAVAASVGVLAVSSPAASAHAPLTGAYLQQGSTGHTVAEVQRALHLRASGRFTVRTADAVMAFQRRSGLQVDSIVGPQTWDTLFHVDGSEAQSSAGRSAAASTSDTATAADASGAGGYTIPASIVQCESGGDYSAVNPSSGAGGAYQILPSTWAAYGGQGLPQDASPAEQNAIAAKIYAAQGSAPWTCG